MIYILSIACFLLGVGYHVMQCIMKLRAKFPQLGFKVVFATFFQQEWDSLLRSLLVMFTFLIYLFITISEEVKYPDWYYRWGVYAIALMAGYAGQRLAYSYLSTAENILEKKAEQLKQDDQ